MAAAGNHQPRFTISVPHERGRTQSRVWEGYGVLGSGCDTQIILPQSDAGRSAPARQKADRGSQSQWRFCCSTIHNTLAKLPPPTSWRLRGRPGFPDGRITPEACYRPFWRLGGSDHKGSSNRLPLPGARLLRRLILFHIHARTSGDVEHPLDVLHRNSIMQHGRTRGCIRSAAISSASRLRLDFVKRSEGQSAR